MIANYIVDFYIESRQVAIELDGRQHLLPENKESDRERDKKLSELGITVLRYTNKSVNSNFNTVCSDIMKNLSITVSDLKE